VGSEKSVVIGSRPVPRCARERRADKADVKGWAAFWARPTFLTGANLPYCDWLAQGQLYRIIDIVAALQEQNSIFYEETQADNAPKRR